MSIADELQSAFHRVVARQKPRQFADCRAQGGQLIIAEQLSIFRMRAAMFAKVWHTESLATLLCSAIGNQKLAAKALNLPLMHLISVIKFC